MFILYKSSVDKRKTLLAFWLANVNTAFILVSSFSDFIISWFAVTSSDESILQIILLLNVMFWYYFIKQGVIEHLDRLFMLLLGSLLGRITLVLGNLGSCTVLPFSKTQNTSWKSNGDISIYWRYVGTRYEKLAGMSRYIWQEYIVVFLMLHHIRKDWLCHDNWFSVIIYSWRSYMESKLLTKTVTTFIFYIKRNLLEKVGQFNVPFWRRLVSVFV